MQIASYIVYSLPSPYEHMLLLLKTLNNRKKTFSKPVPRENILLLTVKKPSGYKAVG
jgi:hypothetical protein